MTVNERSVDSAVPARRVLLLWRRDARGLAPRGAVADATVRRRRRRRDAPGQLPDAHARRVGELVATEPRQAMSDRWAVAVVDSSSVSGGRRRRRPPTDRRRDVCRGPDAVDTRRGRDAGVATAHLWRGRCRRSGREPTPHQAPIRPQRRSDADARRPTSPSASTCRGVFGIGWSASAASGKAWRWRNVRSLRRHIFRLKVTVACWYA